MLPEIDLHIILLSSCICISDNFPVYYRILVFSAHGLNPLHAGVKNFYRKHFIKWRTMPAINVNCCKHLLETAVKSEPSLSVVYEFALFPSSKTFMLRLQLVCKSLSSLTQSTTKETDMFLLKSSFFQLPLRVSDIRKVKNRFICLGNKEIVVTSNCVRNI